MKNMLMNWLKSGIEKNKYQSRNLDRKKDLRDKPMLLKKEKPNKNQTHKATVNQIVRIH
jgi:hypothetical protein